MKVRCIANTGKKLPNEIIKLGYEKTYKFGVEIGKTYTVYSIFFWKGSLDYLLSTSNNTAPSWYPSELFEVENHLLPISWFFTYEKYKNYKGEDSQKAIWGYKEMISDSEHYIDLEEGKKDAIAIFFKRKRQLDEYEKVNCFKL